MSSFGDLLIQLGIFLFGSLYFFVPILGIGLNSYVLYRLSRIARQSMLRFKTSSALPLAAMSFSDSVCLFAQLSQAIFHFAARLHYTDTLGEPWSSGICKIDLYFIHTTSAFSVWCWLVLSVMRYTAVFHPFKYRTIWQQPTIALILIALVCFSFEMWIPLLVVYESNEAFKGCTELPDLDPSFLQTAHLSEIALSYVLPSLVRLLLDTLVLCHCYHPLPDIDFEKTLDDHDDSAMEKKAMTWMLMISNQKHPSSPVHRTNSKCTSKKRKNSMLIRSLLISAVNLMCNFPAILLRIFWTVQGTGDTDVPFTYEWMRFAEPISQMLYFAQFTCNAFYLSTAIFETRATTKLPRRISSSRSAMSKVVSEEPPSINGAPP